MTGEIKFYRTKDPYGCFSNFSAHPVEIDGEVWRTTEHFFQAQKFTDPEAHRKINSEESPMVAARIGRRRDFLLRPDWDSAKDDVMRKAVRAKVRQHADVRETLLGTGDAIIIEHTANNSYWADGGDGSGKNMLGVILMEVRAALRSGHL
ncbi:MAG: NADAR family protein [Hyphomonadaceae bacterium]